MKVKVALLLTLTFLMTSSPMPGQDRFAKSIKGTRSPVLARNGMVCASQPLASAAALRILQQGGNAIDAAVAAAAVLNVVEPMMTGIGGDMFAMVYWNKTGELAGLNGSGHSPAAMNLSYMKNKGYQTMPQTGADAITVPGAVDGWITLLEKYGTLKLDQILAPAIEYADNGFPVSEIISNQWATEVEKLSKNKSATKTYLINGQAPKHGDIVSNKELAATLRKIAANGRDGFYKGEVAEKIIAAIHENGGVMTTADLANQKAEWVKPISTNYKGYDVFELPPNGHGLTVLEMLNILEGVDLKNMGSQLG